ncbi:c-type cytochrome [Falsiroseomonas sp. CW058]|uniref:c-type cytochrome n=1 Tax=Falsiroseomonas sp. CW058 TaxID=3388664 RepID=UPI003D314B20
MRLALAAAALAAALSAPGAGAQDARRGAALAAHACGNCHGADGRSQMAGIPSLAGQPAPFVTMQMILFREGLRIAPPMGDFARGIPDADIEDLAAFFAAQPPGPPDDRAPREPALFDRGRALSERMRCGACHLPDYRGREQIPRLAAQREEFLAATLAEYRDNRRVGSDTQMNAVMYGVADADIAALAHYLAQQ